jgi:hypothetical protein
MNLKTTNAPISKRNGIKAADQETCSDHEDAEYATRAKSSLKKKTTNRRGNIGTALLQAYDNSGNMDRGHRITVSWSEQARSLLSLNICRTVVAKNKPSFGHFW